MIMVAILRQPVAPSISAASSSSGGIPTKQALKRIMGMPTLCQLLAPFIPFVVETMYQNLVKNVDEDAPDSVHHQSWPEADRSLLDEELLADMELAIMVTSLGRSARNSANVKLRQPLAKAVVVGGHQRSVAHSAHAA